MTAQHNITDSVNVRLQEARIAWGIIRNSFITNTKIDTEFRLNYYNAGISTILLYSTNIRPINENALKKLQSPHSLCVSYNDQGKYNKDPI